MASVYCAISGEPPKNPVLNPASGYVYERHLVLKYFRENGNKDPVTGVVLDGGEEGLVDIKRAPSQIPPNNTDPNVPLITPPPPRPPTLTSIPALLHTMQSEWDSVMLECGELRRVAAGLRQDLSHALYKQDAALRVLARITKERDEAREALANITSTLSIPGGPSAAAPAPVIAEAGPEPSAGGKDVEMGEGTSQEAHSQQKVEEYVEAVAGLSGQRRKAKLPSAFFSPLPVSSIRASSSSPSKFTLRQTISSLHSSKKDEQGLSCVSVWGLGGLNGINELKESKRGKSVGEGNIVGTGGFDKVVQIYDVGEDKILATLKGHGKPISSITLANSTSTISSLPAFAVSGSLDKSLRFWSPTHSGSKHAYKHWHILHNAHSGGTLGTSLHPSEGFLLSVGGEGSWSLHDLEAPGGDVRTLISEGLPKNDDDGSDPRAAGVRNEVGVFHPDGAIFGIGGSDGRLRVFDAKSSKCVAQFSDPNSGLGAIKGLGFSENGWGLASCYEGNEGIIKLWDLRKLSNFHTLQAPSTTSGTNGVNQIFFDPSAQYLTAIGGSGVKIWQNKTWDLVWEWNNNEDGGSGNAWTGGGWNRDGTELIVGGMDRTLRRFGLDDSEAMEE